MQRKQKRFHRFLIRNPYRKVSLPSYVEIIIGLRTYSSGDSISRNEVIKKFLDYRKKQIKSVGMTVRAQIGYYEQTHERSMLLLVYWFPSELEKTFSDFMKNINDICEDFLHIFDQKEIYVNYYFEGKPLASYDFYNERYA